VHGEFDAEGGVVGEAGKVEGGGGVERCEVSRGEGECGSRGVEGVEAVG